MDDRMHPAGFFRLAKAPMHGRSRALEGRIFRRLAPRGAVAAGTLLSRNSCCFGERSFAKLDRPRRFCFVSGLIDFKPESFPYRSCWKPHPAYWHRRCPESFPDGEVKGARGEIFADAKMRFAEIPLCLLVRASATSHPDPHQLAEKAERC
ncbi:hypothetical protein D9M68_708190 [compost metagenome]